MDAGMLYGVGLALIISGTLILLIAVLLLFLSNIKGEGKVEGGGAIIIGPIPIVFGTDKKSLKTILILSIALTILLIILMVTVYLMQR